MQFVLAILGLALAGAASNADTIRFKGKEVLVSDSEGVPLFRGRRDFVLKLGHNPDGAVMAYDARSKRVRVSKAGTELWVHCADLEPMPASCAQAPVRQARASDIRGDAVPAVAEASGGEVPLCPGDARCPALPE